MTQELITTDQSLVPVVTEDQIALIKRTVAQGATEAELQLYLYDCRRHGVHPLDRLLHFTKRSGRDGGKYTPITSIDLLRSRAADTGELAGIDDATYTGDPAAPDFAAHVTVWRFVQGQRCPFSATARWSEYKPQEDFMWRKMPHLMLGKCGEALALRKAFPRQLAGLYTADEMAQAGSPPVLPPAPRANPATGEVLPNDATIGEPPASDKQRRYIAALADNMGWSSDAIAAFAGERGIDLATISRQQASILIEQLKEEGDAPAPPAFATSEIKPANGGEKDSRKERMLARVVTLATAAKRAGIVFNPPKTFAQMTEQELEAAGRQLREALDAEPAGEAA